MQPCGNMTAETNCKTLQRQGTMTQPTERSRATRHQGHGLTGTLPSIKEIHRAVAKHRASKHSVVIYG